MGFTESLVRISLLNSLLTSRDNCRDKTYYKISTHKIFKGRCKKEKKRKG